MEAIAAGIGIVGGLLGLAAFVWQVALAIIGYLHISLKVEKAISGSVQYTALVSLENKGLSRKRLDYAMLLIAPENEIFRDTLKQLAHDLKMPRLSVSDTPHLKNNIAEPRYAENKHRAIIPLLFLFREQQGIGIEQINYRCLLDTTKLENGCVYSVKFFVFDMWPWLKYVRWRITQDLLTLN